MKKRSIHTDQDTTDVVIKVNMVNMVNLVNVDIRDITVVRRKSQSRRPLSQ
jgi:hypothetical protein